MKPMLHVDMRDFHRAMDKYRRTTTRDLAEIINQRAFNVAARSFHLTKPVTAPGHAGDVTEQKFKVERYLRYQLSTRVKRATSGKRKGKFIRFVRLNREFQRRHAIINALLGRRGRKGLYGRAMRAYAGKMMGSAIRGVGVLKSVWLPVIRDLWGFVKFRGFAKTTGIGVQRWPGGAGDGKVSIGAPGERVRTVMRLSFRAFKRGRLTSEAHDVVQNALQRALDDEAREMEKHVAEKLKKGIHA